MQKLHLVGVTTDHEGLILSAPRGARTGGYTLAIDDELLEAIDAHRTRLAEEHQQAEEAAARQRAARVESSLPVREIQAQLRRGRSVADVAAAAGVEESWVERFAPPVHAEQAQVAARVLSMSLRRQRLGESALPIGEAVARNLADRGVVLSPGEMDAAWSASQVDDHRWSVRFGFRYRGRDRELCYHLDEAAGEVQAGDRLSEQLGYVAQPARRVRSARQSPPAGAPKRSPAVRPSKERARAEAAMTKAVAKRAREAARARARKVKEREAAQARVERERVEQARAAATAAAAQAKAEAKAAAERERAERARAEEAQRARKAKEAARQRARKAKESERARARKAKEPERKATVERTRSKTTTQSPTARKSTARKATARKATVRKATVRKAAGQSPTARKATGTKATARKATRQSPTARKATGTKATARKATAGKSTVWKAAGQSPTARKATARKATAQRPTVEPTAQSPTAQKAMPGKPARRTPTATRAAVSKAAPSRLAATRPAAKDPAAERPTSEQPAARRSTAETSTVARSAVPEPSAGPAATATNGPAGGAARAAMPTRLHRGGPAVPSAPSPAAAPPAEAPAGNGPRITAVVRSTGAVSNPRRGADRDALRRAITGAADDVYGASAARALFRAGLVEQALPSDDGSQAQPGAVESSNGSSAAPEPADRPRRTRPLRAT